MERIAVFAALQWECRAVLARLRHVERDRAGVFTCWRSRANNVEVSVVKTGVGVSRAAEAIAVLGGLDRYSIVVSSGCAGGLSGPLQPGDVVLATTVCGDGTTAAIATDASRRAEAARIAAAAGLRAVEGPLVCTTKVLTTAEEKRAALSAGAIAVDMEGGPVAMGAAAAGVPFLSVRTILDGADHAVVIPPDLIDGARGTVRPLSLAAYVATHPGKLRELISLRPLHQAARDSLERFFDRWFASHSQAAPQEVR